MLLRIDVDASDNGNASDRAWNTVFYGSLEQE
jgi:hypothetical protein